MDQLLNDKRLYKKCKNGVKDYLKINCHGIKLAQNFIMFSIDIFRLIIL